MAAKPENQGSDREGGAVGGLTPPGEKTLQYAQPAGEQTLVQPPPSNAQNTLIQAQPTIAGANATMPVSGSSLPQPAPSSMNVGGKSMRSSVPDFGVENIQLAVEIQDLTGERLLMAAPRVEAHGRICPALNSIPLLAKIGQGGMGAVYYGIHPRLRSEVAVKVLPFHLAEQDPGMIRRFFREAQIAAQVRSPHLCNVMDVNEEAGLFFLVMEFVTGCTAGQYLKALIEKGTPALSEKDTLDIIIGATEGLWAAHSQGVVHRDIKPDNIMIPFCGKGSKEYDLRRAKLMDLGLARSEESNQSLTGAQSAMGTPGYMAPEQAMDAKTANKASDVFSMGATIYCLLAGKPPFKGETIMKVLMATMHEPHEQVIVQCPHVSPMLNEIVEKCLGKKQETRFGDAKQLLAALEDCRRLVSGGGTTGSFSTTRAGGGTLMNPPSSSFGRSQKTLMNADGTMIQKAPGNKSMLYAALGVTALVLVGGGAYMVTGKKTDPMAGAGGQNPGPVKPVDSGQKLPADTLPAGPPPSEIVLKRHKKLIAEAEESMTNNNPEDARLSLDMARSLLISNFKNAKTAEDKIEKSLNTYTARKDFEKRLKEVDDLARKGEYLVALTKLNLAIKNAPDDEAVKVGETREKNISDLMKAAVGKDKAQKLLNEAEKMIQFTDVELGLEKVAEVRRLFPAADNEYNIKAADVDERLKSVLKEKQKNEEYDRGLKDLKELEAKQSWEQGSKLAWDLRKLLPERTEAPKALQRIQPKLDQKAQDALVEQAKREMVESLAKANELFNANKFSEADEILDGIPKKADAEFVALKTRVDAAIAQSKQETALKRKKNDFAALMTTAKTAVDQDDLAAAKLAIAEAETLFKDDADLAKLKTGIAEKEDFQKAKTEYNNDLIKIRAAITIKNPDEAERIVTLASKNPAVDAKLQNLRIKVSELRDEQKKIQNVEAEYGNLLTAATAFEKAGDEKKELSDKLSSYNYALAKIMTAKPLKKGGEADPRELAIRRKITETQAAEEVARKKAEDEKRRLAEAEAQEALNRKQFDNRLSAAETAVKQGDFNTAFANLGEARILFPSDAQLAKKDGEFKALQAEVDTKIKGSVDAALLRIPQRLYADAIGDMQLVAKQYPLRKELSGVAEGLQNLQRVDTSAQAVLATAAGRLKGIDDKAAGLGKDARARVIAAQTKVQALTNDAIAQIVRSRFGDMQNTVRLLDSDLGRSSRDLSGALDNYEAASKPAPPVKVKPSDAGNIDPFADEGKRKPVQPATQPKGKEKANVGDVNPFD